MQSINSNEKYIIIIQSPSMFNSQDKKLQLLETTENSYESTRIDNSKDQSRLENDFLIKNFLFSKLKVFELSNEVNENILQEHNDDSDLYYHESLLSNAFDSKLNNH